MRNFSAESSGMRLAGFGKLRFRKILKGTITLSIKIAQKLSIIGSLGPKSLKIRVL